MRKVTFGGANTVDNYIAGADENLDWLMWSDEVSEFITSYWKKVDTVVMGRKTYEAGLRLSKGDSNPYPGMKWYVVSRTLTPAETDAFEIARDGVKLLRKLKRQPGKEICVMGGGELGRSLLEAGLIDEIGFNIHPLLLGSGIPLFHPMKRRINLRLLDCRRFKNGCVLVTYRVKDCRGIVGVD